MVLIWVLILSVRRRGEAELRVRLVAHVRGLRRRWMLRRWRRGIVAGSIYTKGEIVDGEAANNDRDRDDQSFDGDWLNEAVEDFCEHPSTESASTNFIGVA